MPDAPRPAIALPIPEGFESAAGFRRWAAEFAAAKKEMEGLSALSHGAGGLVCLAEAFAVHPEIVAVEMRSKEHCAPLEERNWELAAMVRAPDGSEVVKLSHAWRSVGEVKERMLDTNQPRGHPDHLDAARKRFLAKLFDGRSRNELKSLSFELTQPFGLIHDAFPDRLRKLAARKAAIRPGSPHDLAMQLEVPELAEALRRFERRLIEEASAPGAPSKKSKSL